MNIDSEDEMRCTPPDIQEAAKLASLSLLPEKSKNLYVAAYDSFVQWRIDKKTNSFSESVLLVYFTELSAKYKPSTLWTNYSMLRTTINLNHGIDIGNYSKLRTFLKRKSEGFQSKKASIFSTEDVHKFITEAADDRYLATKVALIMGVMGACRANELYTMKLEHLQDLGAAFLIKICKKYISLRSPSVTSNILFLNYQNGKCTSQSIGINKFTQMGKQIATFLQKPTPEKYSSHSFRRSSATILVDAGGDITALKRHGGWKSTAVAEGYIDDSLKNKMETAKKISDSIQKKSPCQPYIHNEAYIYHK